VPYIVALKERGLKTAVGKTGLCSRCARRVPIDNTGGVAHNGPVMTSLGSWVLVSIFPAMARAWSGARGEGHWHFCQFSKLSGRSTLHFVGVTISTCVDPTEVFGSYGDHFG
jgi:hypothetical protein